MAWSILVKKIGKPQLRLNSAAFVKTMREQMETFANAEVIPMYEAGVQTWSELNKPDFTTKFFISSSGFVFAIGTNSENSDVYRFIDQGTSHRWALMSYDWISKSDPSRYWSENGRGTVLLRGRKEMSEWGLGPRMGIEARDFTGNIMKEIQPWWKRWTKDAMRLALIDMKMGSWK